MAWLTGDTAVHLHQFYYFSYWRVSVVTLRHDVKNLTLLQRTIYIIAKNVFQLFIVVKMGNSILLFVYCNKPAIT